MKLDLSKAMEQLLAEYEAGIEETVNDKLEDVVKETVAYLKAKSPRSKKGGKHYANGWTEQADVKWYGTTLTIYNKTKPQLTHLLNDGHSYVTRSGVREFEVKGDQHIDDAEAYANALLIEKVERALK